MTARWHRTLFALAFLLLAPRSSAADEILYGGNGGHGTAESTNDGSLLIVDPGSAAVTGVGHPDGVARLTGIAFDPSGALFASTMTGGGFPPPPPAPLTSTLIELDPSTGRLLATIGPIRDGPGGPPMSVSDIAFQPGTGALFGVRSNQDGLGQPGRIYRIDKTTGIATSLGNTPIFFATIAFAPNGTLYEVAADLGPAGPSSPRLRTLNPATGEVLSAVSSSEFYGALTVRPSDGALFGSTGDDHEIFRIDPATGQGTLVGDTGRNFIGALVFRPQAAACTPDARTLCLSSGRFRVETEFRSREGNGLGNAVALTPDAGYFWFFNPQNIEVVVKVLDACSFSPNFWVFGAGLTNVEVTMTVVDTRTGALRTYFNALDTTFVTVTDTAAFATCP